MSRLILDAGAFVAFERGDVHVRARLTAARRLGIEVVTTSPVVAQVWRDGRRQAHVANLLAATEVFAPTQGAARRAGELLAKTKTSDVVDALVADLARDGDCILTSDPRDIGRLIERTQMRALVVATQGGSENR